jgi:predicted nucleic acid-binding protein
MRHVFVETNWLVAYAAPAHHKIPDAVELLARASAGEIQLHLPSICISEARNPLQENFQLRSTADRVRDFLCWAKRERLLEEETTRRVLDKMESRIRTDLSNLNNVVTSLEREPGLEIFDLNQAMLERCAELS